MTAPFAKIGAELCRKRRASLEPPRHQSDGQGYFWPFTPLGTCECYCGKMGRI
jgi:hypothetical protein